MIKITSLSEEEMILNSDHIYKIEEFSDTVITLLDGRTLRVAESAEQIVEKIVAFKRRIFSGVLEEEE